MPKPVFIDCSPGSSLFKIIDTLWEDTTGNSNNRVIHRLCSLMRKMDAITIIKERLLTGDDSEVDLEYSSLHEQFNNKITFSSVYRLTFVNVAINSSDALGEIPDNKFLGYAILINANWEGGSRKKSYILSSVVRLPYIECLKCDECVPPFNNYYHVFKTFDCAVSLKKGFRFYKVTGTFFSQQNGFTSVCAHAALKTIVNNVSSSNSYITSDFINKKLNKLSTVEGLSIDEIQSLLKELKFNVVYYDFFDNPNDDYASSIHHLIESAAPCLLIFTTERQFHVVTVLGHSINNDIWKPEAELAYGRDTLHKNIYRPATMWVDNFIIHDDNFGMYLSLPVESLKRVTIPFYDRKFRAFSAIGIIPHSIQTTKGQEAEIVGDILLTNLLKTIKNLIPHVYWLNALYNKGRAPRVIRSALMGKERYKQHLGYKDSNRKKDSNGNCFTDETILKLTCDLPENFWFCEVTLPDLYSTNTSKLVDIIYRCDLPPANDLDDMLDKCVMIRIPSVAVKYSSENHIDEVIPTEVDGHYPLFHVSRDLEII